MPITKTQVRRIERILQEKTIEKRVNYEIVPISVSPFCIKCTVDIVKDGRVIGQIDPDSEEGREIQKQQPFEFSFDDDDKTEFDKLLR